MAELRTVIEMLPDLLGPNATPFDLRCTDREGAEYESAQLVMVSNNRYQPDPLRAQGTRGTMDDGTLGVVVVPEGPPLRRRPNSLGPRQPSCLETRWSILRQTTHRLSSGVAAHSLLARSEGDDLPAESVHSCYAENVPGVILRLLHSIASHFRHHRC